MLLLVTHKRARARTVQPCETAALVKPDAFMLAYSVHSLCSQKPPGAYSPPQELSVRVIKVAASMMSGAACVGSPFQANSVMKSS